MKINDEQVIGLDNCPHHYFSTNGCDNCNNKLGQDIYQCKAYLKRERWEEDHCVVNLCQSCLNSYFNGEPLEEDCQNKFHI